MEREVQWCTAGVGALARWHWQPNEPSRGERSLGTGRTVCGVATLASVAPHTRLQPQVEAGARAHCPGPTRTTTNLQCTWHR